MKTEPPIAISTGCFYQIPIGEVLHHFADHDFDQLEICTFPAHLDFHETEKVAAAARSMEEHGLTAVSLHAPFAGHIDISSWEESVRCSSVDELRRACDSARTLQATYIVLHPGPEQDHKLSPHE